MEPKTNPMLATDLLDPEAAKRLSSDVEAYKNEFVNCLKSVCPDFVQTPVVAHALDKIYRWAVADTTGPLDPRKGLCVIGRAASGKTTVATALSRFLIGVRGRKPGVGASRPEGFRAADILDQPAGEIIRSLAMGADPAPHPRDVAVLVINDAEPTDFTAAYNGSGVSVMRSLLDSRASLNRNFGGSSPTVVTMRKHPDDVAKETRLEYVSKIPYICTVVDLTEEPSTASDSETPSAF